MDSNRQMQELDIFLTQGFDPISEADIAVDDVTDKLNKFFSDEQIDEAILNGQLDSLFKNAHVEPNPAADPLLPIRSAPSPASGASSITDEQMDKALDAAEDSGELSAMTRWLASQVWHGKNAGDLLVHAMQGDPSRAALMQKAAANLNLVAA